MTRIPGRPSRTRRDAATASSRQRLPLVYDNGPHVTQIDFRGYAYETASVGDLGRYVDRLRRDEAADLERPAPRRDHSEDRRARTEGRLHHRRRIRRAARARARSPRHRYTSASTDEPIQRRSVSRDEGRRSTRRTRAAHASTIEGAWAREKRTLDRGAIFVSTHQPNVRLDRSPARSCGARIRSRSGASSRRRSSARSTWRRTSPRRPRARCSPAIRRCRRNSMPRSPPIPSREEPRQAARVLLQAASRMGRAHEPVADLSRRRSNAKKDHPLKPQSAHGNVSFATHASHDVLNASRSSVPSAVVSAAVHVGSFARLSRHAL